MTVTDNRAYPSAPGDAVHPPRPDGGPSVDQPETEWQRSTGPTPQPFDGGREYKVGTERSDPQSVGRMATGPVAPVDHRGRRRRSATGDAVFAPRGWRGTGPAVEAFSEISVAVTGQPRHATRTV